MRLLTRILMKIPRLLEHGADPNIQDKLGGTPLHYAAFRGANVEIINVLLDAGADPRIKNSAQVHAFGSGGRIGGHRRRVVEALQQALNR